MQNPYVHITPATNPYNMHPFLYLEGVAPGDEIVVITRDDVGETVKPNYNATFVRTEGDARVIISEKGVERTIRLYDTLNFNDDAGYLYVVEQLETV